MNQAPAWWEGGVLKGRAGGLGLEALPLVQTIEDHHENTLLILESSHLIELPIVPVYPSYTGEYTVSLLQGNNYANFHCFSLESFCYFSHKTFN